MPQVARFKNETPLLLDENVPESSNFQKVVTFEGDSDPVLSGHRIVDLQYILKWALPLQTDHSKICPNGKLNVSNEKSVGLVSEVTLKCDTCDFETTNMTENPNSQTKLNKKAVWGTLNMGNDFSQLKEFLEILNIPFISINLFYQIEGELGEASGQVQELVH